MGLLLSRLTQVFQEFVSTKDKESRIILLGLDAAGKTTILYKIKLKENIHTIPTIGFNVETVSPVKGLNFTVWDVGGQKTIRNLWKHYYQNTDGLIFVVDSKDSERFELAREELHAVLSDDNMARVPVVVLANKQDLPGVMSPSQLVNQLDLPKLKCSGHDWHIQAASAINGEGLYEGMHQMASMIKASSR